MKRHQSICWVGIAGALEILSPATAWTEPCRAQFHDRDRAPLRGELLLRAEHFAVIQNAESASVDTLVLSELYVLETSTREISPGLAAATVMTMTFLGGIAGGLLGSAMCDSDSPDFGFGSSDNDVSCDSGIIGIFVGGAVGTGIGLLIGLQPREEWTIVHASPEYQHDHRLLWGWNDSR